MTRPLLLALALALGPQAVAAEPLRIHAANAPLAHFA
ncbi:hypothetical protein BH23PSE1_BH23PSE1_03530 [soil metagenome]